MPAGVRSLALALVSLVFVLVSGCGVTTADRPTTGASVDPVSGLPYIDQDQLPVQARQALRLIDQGGPYPYDEDGSVFGNREQLLPDEPSGYYREYTVTTPGEDDRGARRIVSGDDDSIFYYTDDHYESFSRIRR